MTTEQTPILKQSVEKTETKKLSSETRRKISEACSLHGAYKELRRWKQGKRPDRRSRFGKYIALVEEAIVNDLGGHENLSQKQRLLLDRVIEKLTFLERIGAWSMEQESIVDSKGNLLPALGKSYIAYSNALRLDLRELYEDKQGENAPTYKEIIQSLEEDD